MTVAKQKSSQVAKVSPWYDQPPKLLTPAQLAEKGAVSKAIDKARRKNAYGKRVGRQAMYHALTHCVCIAYYLLLQEAAWEAFCETNELGNKDRTPDVVLYAVLLRYAGSDEAGQKTASRYKRALLSRFELSFTPLEIYAELCVAGVDGMLNEDKKDDDEKAKPEKLRKASISASGTYLLTLPKGYKQTVVIETKEAASFTIKVTKAAGAFKKPKGLKLTTAK